MAEQKALQKLLEPENNSVVSEDFTIRGWAADLKNSPPIELKKYYYTSCKEDDFLNILA